MVKCEHCDREFEGQQGLTVHIARKHKDVAPPTTSERRKARNRKANRKHRAKTKTEATQRAMNGAVVKRLKFCPECGEHLEPYNLAAEITSNGN